MADVLEVAKREKTGSAASRRLRRDGLVPAILYGHGQENENLAVPQRDVKALLRHHGKMVELKGAVKDNALVSDMQWDPLGIEVIHLDLIRVNLSEKVEVTVAIHAHGDPIGVREGGILLENLHEVEIRCPAGSIPESVGLNVSEIHLGEHRTAGDLELPAEVELVTSPETVVAHVEAPRKAAETEQAEDSLGAEPEVIAKGSGEGEDEEGS